MKALNAKNIAIERSQPVKVLQFGEGNFLRGFVDWIIEVLNEKTDFNGGVYIVQPIEHGIIDLINRQDGLYHVWLNGISNGSEVNQKKLIKCISGAMDPHKDYQGFLALAENENLQFVVSNTTEAGIIFNEADASIDTLPAGFPGKLTALLFHRYKYFNGDADKGLTIIPCELINKNGEALRKCVLKYAQHFDLPEGFIDWIKSHNIFCNTLVDRIVPGFPKEVIDDIQTELGLKDDLVVQAEPFHLWVIEAPESVKQTLPTAEAGLQVKFVDDLTPYRTRKVRILNGAHTAMVPVAYLHGLRTVGETIENDSMNQFVKAIIFDEIIPTLDLPQEELEQFANDVIERFKNPFIRHELITISLNSIAKFKVRVLPSILEYLKREGQLPDKLLYALASLIVFYKGAWNGETIPLNDTPDVLKFFTNTWKSDDTREVVNEVLANVNFWGEDLTAIEGFSQAVKNHADKILKDENINQAKSA